jgi:hypothetical protein
LGRVGYFSDAQGDLRDRKTVASNGLAVVRMRDIEMAPFVSQLLFSGPYQEWMKSESTGSTIRHLNIRRLRHLP